MGNFLRLCEVVVKKIKRKGERKTAFSCCCSLSAHVRPESQESGWEGGLELCVFPEQSTHSRSSPAPRKPVRGARGRGRLPRVCSAPSLQTAAPPHPRLCPLRAAVPQQPPPSRFFHGFQPAAPCPKRVGAFACVFQVEAGVGVKRNKKFIRLIRKATGGGRGKQRVKGGASCINYDSETQMRAVRFSSAFS